MGLFGDITGALGLNFRDQVLNGALRLIGVDGKMNHAIRAAAELSKGITKDGFDWDKVNKGVLTRNAMKAFGIDNPIAHLGGTAALKMIGPSGFASIAGLAGGGALLSGLSAGGSGGVLAGLNGMQLGIGALLTGIVGGAGFGGPGDIAGTIPKFLFGNKTSEMRGLLGMTRSQGGLGSQMANLPRPAYFEDIVAAFMIDVVKDKQEDIEGRLKELDSKDQAKKKAGNQVVGQAAGTVAGKANEAAQDGNSDSRNIQFEIIKNEIQKLTEMQQAMSNVLNTMHEQAQSAIRNIKA